MVVRSPAKINLFLYVTGKRDDGYHDLFTLMTKVKIFDEVSFDFSKKGIHISCDNPSIPCDESNLAHRAASVFYSATGIEKGVSINLKKTIPAGAGLGGGSANAATVLSTLNDHYNTKLSGAELSELGLSLGADVPFFLFKGPKVAQGVGEKLEDIVLKKYHLVIIFPDTSVSTASIFRNLNLTLTKSSKKIKELLLWESEHKIPFDACEHLWNDLEIVTRTLYPQINEAKEALTEGGAVNVLMTGSGSAVFGLFHDRKSAEKGFDFVKKSRTDSHRKWQFFQTEFE